METTDKKSGNKLIGYLLIAAMVIAIGYFGVYKIATGQETMNTQTAFLTMLMVLVIGEVISTKTKAFVPSMFISAVIFVIGFWTYFPKDILQLAGVATNLPGFLVMMMVVHLGTMLDIQELVAQWKTCIITIAGMLGILAAILTIGSLILGMETAAIAAPPLTGGLVAALMMQNCAGENQHLFILAMAVYVMQGFAGYPLTSICLKKEGRSIISQYRAGTLKLEKTESVSSSKFDTKHIFPQIPEKYKSDFTYILLIVVIVVISGYLELLTAGKVSKFVWALILGVFAQAFGFIESKALLRARSMGLVYTLIMMYVFSNLSAVTPEVLVQLIKDFAILIVLSVAGVALFSIPVGKKLGLSAPMSFALGLGTLAGGFPASYTLSVEAAKVISETDEEYELLENHMLPKTLVAGFISATSGSVIIAGLVMSIFFS